MARLIDADALKLLICSNVYPVVDYSNSKDYGMFWTGGIEKAIDEQPTVDAVPVIRCKYCTYQSTSIDGQKVCMLPNGYTPLGYDEGFCSMAERKKMG